MNELEKIECMFASAMFDVYTQRRFGLKSCRPRIDESTLYDILKLYLNSLSIAEWVYALLVIYKHLMRKLIHYEYNNFIQ